MFFFLVFFSCLSRLLHPAALCHHNIPRLGQSGASWRIIDSQVPRVSEAPPLPPAVGGNQVVNPRGRQETQKARYETAIWNSAHEVKKCLIRLLTKRNSGVLAASAARLDYCCDTACSPHVNRDHTVTSLPGHLRSPQSRFQQAARDILSGRVCS